MNKSNRRLAATLTLSVIVCSTGCQQALHDMKGELPDNFDGANEVRRDPQSGQVSSVRGPNLALELELTSDYQALKQEKEYAAMALEFLDHYRRPFALENPREELAVARVESDQLGYHRVRLSQSFANLPVLDSELIVHFNPDDQVYMVNGDYLSTPTDLSIQPGLSSDSAARRIRSEMGGDVDVDGGNLVIFPGPPGPALGYEFEVSRSLTEAWRIVVDANTGATLMKRTLVVSGSD